MNNKKIPYESPPYPKARAGKRLLCCNIAYEKLQRARDVVLSILALSILWPFLLLIGILIMVESPGAGPIFGQTRIGKGGKPFTCYKIRTMYPNAEQELEGLLSQNEMDGPVFKMRGDPRITRLGRFLRRTGFDELPQLWNVLRGEMSIVGPRPGLPREVKQYDEHAARRLQILPGITCYWQIQRNRNTLPFERWVELDLQYIDRQNFREDWIIIWKTFGAIIRMDGM